MRLSDQNKVSIVAGLCLVGLVIVLKNLLLIPSDILSRDVLVYIIIYWAFTVIPGRRGEKGSKYDHPLYWSLLIILITLVIITMYLI